MIEDRAIIANITEQNWIAQRTYGTFLIPGCGTDAVGDATKDASDRAGLAGRVAERSVVQAIASLPGLRMTMEGAEQGCALTEITPRKGTIDLGDKRVIDFPISAREIALDIVREINSDAGDASFLGVFVCAGDAPTDAELADARARLEAFYRRQVEQADIDWERTHNFLMITDVERRASRWLGLEKEWAYQPRPLVDCPACGDKLKPGVAVCKSCGAVLDRAKAAQFGLVAEVSADSAGASAARVPPETPELSGRPAKNKRT